MSALLIVLASLVVYGVGWFRSSLYLARRFNESHEERYSMLPVEDYLRMHIGLAMLIALVWPLVLPMFAIHAAMVSRVGPTRRQVELENNRLRDEITRLERETGVAR